MLPGDGTKAMLPGDGTTAMMPEDGTTAMLPDDPSNIFYARTHEPEPVQMRKIVRTIVAPKHTYGKVPACFLKKFTADGPPKGKGKAGTCPVGDFEYDFDFGCRRIPLCKYDHAWENRYTRHSIANSLRTLFTYGVGNLGEVKCNNVVEKKFLIRSNSLVDTWEALSSGITWVAVYGMNSICVVTRNEYLDMTRWKGVEMTKDSIFFSFRKILVDEMEDLAEPSGKICKKYNWSVSKPFAVVSLIPVCEGSGNEALSDVYYEDNAIAYLKGKLQDCSTLTYTETIQTAISAFQILFGKEFRANDIKVIGLEDIFSTGQISPTSQSILSPASQSMLRISPTSRSI